MNAKKVKKLRRLGKEFGVNVKHVEYQAITHKKQHSVFGTITAGVQYVLAEGCGRKKYKQAKEVRR